MLILSEKQKKNIFRYFERYTNKYINLISLIITIIIFLILNILFIKTPNISEKNMSNIIPKINFNLKKEKINNKIKTNISDEELETLSQKYIGFIGSNFSKNSFFFDNML